MTVAWTDAPGSTAGDAYNNDLDLTVTAGGNTYKGNVFSGAYSTTGGTADAADNVESVFLPAGTTGLVVITVTAANINSDGVPNNTNAPDQDFALAGYNVIEREEPSLAPAGSSVSFETCQPTNGVVDPGETVTVNFALQNIGSLDTTNLVATLLESGGVAWPGGPQSYGVVAAGGGVVSEPFTFTANATCGQTITATLQLQDGAANLGAVSFSLPVGQFVPVTTFAENFDEVTPPAIPTNWTTSADNGQSVWITTADASDTVPNSAYVAEPDFPSSSELVTPVIAILSSSAQLWFMNNCEAEADPSVTSVAYDGGVLEISINGGAFTDILDAGGSFVTNGYTRTIQSSDDNPLDGRAVWSGNTGGFLPTIVNLPAAAAGQNIQLKWRFGTDTGNYYGGSGWYIDTVSILDGYYACCTAGGPPVIIAGPGDQAVLAGRNATYQVFANGAPPLSYQWSLNGTNLPGATGANLTLTNVQPGEAGACSVTVTNVAGSTNAFADLVVSVPGIGGITVGPTNVTLSVSSIAGVTYTLQYKNSLKDPAWTPVTPAVPGTGGWIMLQDAAPQPPSRYYRIRCD